MIKDNEFYIIKPFKNRDKHEIYVHNESLRRLLATHPIWIVHESLEKPVVFEKKIVARSKSYISLVERLLEHYISTPDTDKHITSKNLKVFSAEMIEKIPSHLDIRKFDIREGYFSHIEKTFEQNFKKRAHK